MPDRRRILRALNRAVWAAATRVVRDSRGTTVPVFDSRVRLWRDPPGLDFPTEDFRRVAARLRPRRVAPPPHAPGWAITAGLAGAGVLMVAALAGALSPMRFVVALMFWIAFWWISVGAWVDGTQGRVSSPDPLAEIRYVRPPAFFDWVRVYSRLPVMILSCAVFAIVFWTSRHTAPPALRIIEGGVVVLYGVTTLYYGVAAGRKFARMFPPANELQVARALLAEHRCASCAYDLGAVEPEPDGCTVCPECGAAWRRGRADAVSPVYIGA
jgi:hypothetical protein